VVQSDDWFHLATLSPVIDTLPRTRRRLNSQKTGCAIKVSQCSGHLYWIKLVLTDSMSGLIFWWSQSGLYATALNSESVYSWRDSVTWPEHWLAITVNYETFFQEPRSPLVLRRASSAGGKVFRFSQSALCTTAVGSKSLYWRFDSL